MVFFSNRFETEILLLLTLWEGAFNERSVKKMNREDLEKVPKYSLEVYDDHAIIKGWLTSDMLTVLIKLCRKEGFKRLVSGNGGFKLIK